MDGEERPDRPAASLVYGAMRRVLGVAHKVTRPVLLDTEHVPESGPFLLVGNHTLLGVQDVPALVHEVERRRGVRLRVLGDHAHFAVPVWRELLASLGAVRGTPENCAALLEAGEGVLVFPGGAREVFKRRGQQYQLLWGERMGFARMAIEAGCPIVPFAAVGAEDRFRVVVDVDDPLGRAAGAIARRVGRPDVATVLVAGAGPAMLPAPERLYFRFGEAIDTGRWAGRATDAKALAECRDRARADVQAQLDFLREYRESDPERGLTARLIGTVRGPRRAAEAA